MIALENVSRQIEEIRKTDPYYLCTKTLVMGSMFADGNFLYVDEKHPKRHQAIRALFSFAEQKKIDTNSASILFRDFEENHFMCKVLEEEGYAKIRMPNTIIVENKPWKTNDDYLKLISSKNDRRNFRRYIFNNEYFFDITVKKELSQQEADIYYRLFSNIKDQNFAFNFFKFPVKVCQILSKYDEWEFIEIKLKESDKIIGCIWSFVGDNHYSPLIMGLDYDYLESHQIYKQAVFQMIKRGVQLKKQRTFLGFSAEYEKKKHLAEIIPVYAFMKVDDTFNLDLLDSFANFKV